MVQVIEAARAAPSTASQPIRPRQLAHIVFQTADVDRMRDWYVEVLGAEVQHDAFGAFRLSFITFDEEHHRVAFVQVPKEALPPRGLSPVSHVAFSYAALGELLATYERLATKGIEPVWPINHGATLSIYYRDPDGNSVELQVDTMTSAEANEYVHSRDFQENPIGVTFDPKDLLDRFRAGAPESELLRRPALPPGKTPADMIRR